MFGASTDQAKDEDVICEGKVRYRHRAHSRTRSCLAEPARKPAQTENIPTCRLRSLYSKLADARVGWPVLGTLY